MPTYDYVCDACGHTFEHFQSMSAAPLKECPQCAKKALKRLIGIGAGVIFKGEGFYTTDYRSESYKKAAESEKSAGKPDAAKDAPATTPAAKGDGATPKPATTETPKPAAESPAPKPKSREAKKKAS